MDTDLVKAIRRHGGRVALEMWRGDNPGKRANLEGADLFGADLRRADLRSAKLMGANLEIADCRYADMDLADLRETNFTGAEMLGANIWAAAISPEGLERYIECIRASVKIVPSSEETKVSR